MDVRQYGPALFPTVKQVRNRLYERGLFSHGDSDATQVEWTEGTIDDGRSPWNPSE